MATIDKIVLSELVSDELSKLDLEDLMGLAKEVHQALSFCLSRMIACSEFVGMLHSLVRALPQVRLSKVISGTISSHLTEEAFIDLKFLKEVLGELYTYYAALVFGLVDHELRVPVKFEEDIVIGGCKYKAYSSKLVNISKVVALQRIGAKIRIIAPREILMRISTAATEGFSSTVGY